MTAPEWTLFLARDGVVTKRPSRFEQPSKLLQDACGYRSFFPTCDSQSCLTQVRWAEICQPFATLIRECQEWYEREANRPLRSKSFQSFVKLQTRKARQQKLHGFAMRILMEQVEFELGAMESLQHLAAKWPGPIFLLSNQENEAEAGYAVEELRQLNRTIVSWIHAMGGRITESRMWPHPPAADEMPSTPYRLMIGDIAASASVDWSRACFVVDHAPAAEVVQAFPGMQALLVRTGRGNTLAEASTEAPILDNLVKATERLVGSDYGDS